MNTSTAKKFVPLVLVFIVLLVLVLVNIPSPLQTALAGRKPQSQLGAMSGAAATGTTNALAVAIKTAKATGLVNDPQEIYVASGNYNTLSDPDTSSARFDNRNVWLVWMKAPYQLKNGLLTTTQQNYQVSDIYVYIDKLTGNPFEFRWAAGGPLPWLQTVAWQSVTLQDASQFPIPVYNPDNDPGALLSAPVVNDASAPEIEETPLPPSTPTLIP
jgi:hypothetical protein